MKAITFSKLIAPFTLAALLATSALASTAHAQEIGTQGNFVFGVERLFGFYVDKQSVDTPVGTATTSVTDLSLGWNHAPTALSTPRLSLDYFITEHFTIGGAFGFYTLSTDVGARGLTATGADETGVIFVVRGGYALRLGHAFAFWPRVGLSYDTINVGGTAGDRHLLAFTLEGMFTLAPSENWAFMVGPTVDIGIDGAVGNTDVSENCFGIMAGIVGWFGG